LLDHYRRHRLHGVGCLSKTLGEEVAITIS
jgi:hypothetical protein